MMAEALLDEGNKLLKPILEPVGFEVSPVTAGQGSGGGFAVCRWTRGTQFIELHVRHALGIVEYGWGDEIYDHQHLLAALAAVDRAAYPGFSDDPLDGFRHLAADLSGLLNVVVGAASDDALETARSWTPPQRTLP